ncbi:MAG: hypothetical protein MPW15_00780 [Candidatus Manganitrophus sp.]|nr:hypothetical protein [Candidatus Manganitrophus sp.]
MSRTFIDKPGFDDPLFLRKVLFIDLSGPHDKITGGNGDHSFRRAA